MSAHAPQDSITSDTVGAARGADATTAHQHWLLATSTTGIVLIGVAAQRPLSSLLAFLPWAALVFAALALRHRSAWRAADWVTTLRVGLFLIAAAFSLDPEARILVTALFVLAAVGDLLDGYVARRYGSGPHGAVLDMEADQLFVFALALAALLKTDSSSDPALWLLVFPGLKYAFTAAQLGLRLPAGNPQPDQRGNQRARWVYFTVVLLLLGATLPRTLPDWYLALLALAAVALTASFAGDLLHTLRQRREPQHA